MFTCGVDPVDLKSHNKRALNPRHSTHLDIYNKNHLPIRTGTVLCGTLLLDTARRGR